MNKIDNVVRKSHSMGFEQFSSEIINLVAQLSNAFAAVLYTKNRENTKFILSACYGCDKDTVDEKEVSVGEGIIGQAIADKESRFLSKIPSENTNTKIPGLQINHVNILVLPLEFGDRICGVFQFTFISDLEEKIKNFLDEAAEVVAPTLDSLYTHEYTQTLLIESKEQTEQLRAQEEEMRQNLEEITATQDVLEQQQQSLQLEFRRVQAIKETSPDAIITIDTKGEIQTVNSATQEIFGYSEKEMVGQNVKYLCPKDTPANTMVIWNAIKENKQPM
jgi:PAS domain-containing protein